MGGANSPTRIKPTMGLWALLFYGIVVIQPTAPLGSFGIVSQVAKGHVATALLVAMFAMTLTAFSYGRMASVYPSAGSAYTYVSKTIHPKLGFLVGWCIALDYLLLPTIGTIWCAKAAINVWPLPYSLYVVAFATLFTSINLRGIEATTRTNVIVTIALIAVIAAFLISAVVYITGIDGTDALFQTRPFYDPDTFSWGDIGAGTSIAVLTYMGFDCISTLSEDTHNPRRNILIATVALCLVTGLLGIIQVYAGQIIWPDFGQYPDVDTAFVAIAGRAGGPTLFHTMNLALLVATIGSSLGAQLGAARLLFAMGRDGVIPRGIFSYLGKKNNAPTFNILLVYLVIVIGALTLSYQKGAELVNFGAFIAFMGVNLSVVAHFYTKGSGRDLQSVIFNLAAPIAAFALCLTIWLNLSNEAKVAGFVWLGIGVVFNLGQSLMVAHKDKGQRRKLESTSPADLPLPISGFSKPATDLGIKTKEL